MKAMKNFQTIALCFCLTCCTKSQKTKNTGDYKLEYDPSNNNLLIVQPKTEGGNVVLISNDGIQLNLEKDFYNIYSHGGRYQKYIFHQPEKLIHTLADEDGDGLPDLLITKDGKRFEIDWKIGSDMISVNVNDSSSQTD